MDYLEFKKGFMALRIDTLRGTIKTLITILKTYRMLRDNQLGITNYNMIEKISFLDRKIDETINNINTNNSILFSLEAELFAMKSYNNSN